jgi:hypothetical protein
MTGYVAAAILTAAMAIPFPCLAQKPNLREAQQQRQAQRQQRQQERAQVKAQQAGHAGDWLRRYKDMPPDEQEKALRNDPAFQHLSPERQQALRDRLQHFSNLPPQQQLNMLNRMETWEHLTPEQKQQARQVFAQFRQLPPDRQRMVRTAIRDLRAMPPDQREQIINSDRFKGMYSEQERGMMREVSRLPLAPAEEGEAAPQE